MCAFKAEILKYFIKCMTQEISIKAQGSVWHCLTESPRAWRDPETARINKRTISNLDPGWWPPGGLFRGDSEAVLQSGRSCRIKKRAACWSSLAQQVPPLQMRLRSKRSGGLTWAPVSGPKSGRETPPPPWMPPTGRGWGPTANTVNTGIAKGSRHS